MASSWPLVTPIPAPPDDVPSGRVFGLDQFVFWPGMADWLALACDGVKDQMPSKSAAHLAGFLDPSTSSMVDVLGDMDFVPSAKRARSSVGNKVSACVQPARRVSPTIMPEGLSPEAHLGVALC